MLFHQLDIIQQVWMMLMPAEPSIFSDLTANFLAGSDGKLFTCNVGDLGLIAGSQRSSGGRNGNPLQYSHVENSTNRRTFQATVYKVA